MKKLMIALLLAAPAGAQAAWMHGGMHGAMRFGPPPMGMHFAAILYAALAALGYWVLQHAAPQTDTTVRRTGKTVAWVLIVFGLLGLLCGVANHVKMHSGCCGKCAAEAGMPAGGGGAEWREAEGSGEAGGPAKQTIQVQVKTEKPAPKKK